MDKTIIIVYKFNLKWSYYNDMTFIGKERFGKARLVD